MTVEADPTYVIIAYATVGLSWWLMGRNDSWLWLILFAPLTAPIFWTIGLFYFISYIWAKLNHLIRRIEVE